MRDARRVRAHGKRSVALAGQSPALHLAHLPGQECVACRIYTWHQGARGRIRLDGGLGSQHAVCRGRRRGDGCGSRTARERHGRRCPRWVRLSGAGTGTGTWTGTGTTACLDDGAPALWRAKGESGRSPVNLSRGGSFWDSLASSASCGSLWVSRSRRALSPHWRSPAARGEWNGKWQRAEIGGRAVSAPPIFPSLFSSRRPHWLRQREGESRKKRDAAVIGRHQLRLQRSRGCRSKAEEASFEVSCIVVQGVTP